MNFYSLVDEKFQTFRQFCKLRRCFRNLLTKNVVFSSKAWSTIKLLLAIIFVCYFIILSIIFLLPIRSPRFLFRLYAIGTCSNKVLRIKFICNKCQCLLITCFILGGNVLFYVKAKGILFWYFLSTLVLVMRFFWLLIVVEILHLKIFRWHLDL